jgi:hypothetical protein
VRKRWQAAIIVAICTLFLILNQSAYNGFFQDDELDNIVNTREIPPSLWLHTFITPKLAIDNFRPSGHIYFALANRYFQLNFPKWMIPLQLLHLLNGVLLWMLLRRLGIGVLGCTAGLIFFLLNVAAFDAYWKPMYIFDVVCTTFCLTTLLLYAYNQWLLAIPIMWLAYKSKELAIMLPVVLTAFEYLFAERRWRRLIPFFLISLTFGVQALLNNGGPHTDYSLVFTPQALGKTLTFYSSRLFVLPFAGLVLIALPFVFRERRMFLGAIMMAAFFFPLLFLPGRLFPAYCYLPLTGAAVEIADMVGIVPPAWSLAFFVLWMPWNLFQFRKDRHVTLAMDQENRIYVNGLIDYAKAHPELPQLAFSQVPVNFHLWGIQAALNYSKSRPGMDIAYLDEPHARALPASSQVTFLNWDRQKRKLFVISKDPSAPDVPYLHMDAQTPVWQLEEGWYSLDGYFRWTEPHASARLRRPENATVFEAVVNVSPALIQKYGYSNLRISIDGKVAGSKRFETAGVQTVRWNLPPGAASTVKVVFDVEPSAVYPPDTRTLGIAMVAFGFV